MAEPARTLAMGQDEAAGSGRPTRRRAVRPGAGEARRRAAGDRRADRRPRQIHRHPAVPRRLPRPLLQCRHGRAEPRRRRRGPGAHRQDPLRHDLRRLRHAPRLRLHRHRAAPTRNLNVKIIAGLPGLTTGYGGTHQAIEDLALMRMIPGLTIIDPCDATEIEAGDRGDRRPSPARSTCGCCAAACRSCSTAGYTLRDRQGAAAARRQGCRHHLDRPDDRARARRRRRRSAKRGISVGVLHVPTIKPFDAEAVAAFAASRRPGRHRREPCRRRRPREPRRRGAVRCAASRKPVTRIGLPDRYIECGVGADAAGALRPHHRRDHRDHRRPALRSCHEDHRDRDLHRRRRLEELAVRQGPHRRRHPRHRRGHAERLHHAPPRPACTSSSTSPSAQDPRRINALAKRMLDSVSLDGGHIHRTVIAAIEVACWDILGKRLGVPIHQLLGGRVRDSVLGYANGWYRTERTPEAFLEAAKAVLAKGFKAFKLDPFGTAQGFISRDGARPRLRHLPDAARQAAGRHADPDRRPCALHRDRGDLQAARALRRSRHLLVGGADLARPPGDRARGGAPLARSRWRPARCTTPSASSTRSPPAAASTSSSPSRCRSAASRHTHAGGQPGARPWQLHRAAPERRAGGDGGLPAARGGGAELPDPGAFRRLQRALDARPRHLASDDRSGERPPVAARRAGPRHRPQHRCDQGASLRSARLSQRPRGGLGEAARARDVARGSEPRATELQALSRSTISKPRLVMVGTLVSPPSRASSCRTARRPIS